ncbi:Hsp70 protein [Stackebrandtia albiflava]|uniref:Hsp70 protein n=1 Tax=Stackebrandtia albiflava TaxID=406432 RepID=A0A562VAX6_9ACTN|nr:Hsp70 family protein [Stackebrandtia albiflava]TWJ15014.1 Hsp70 protein [Stackebrandtia albiflava]
MDSAPRSHLGVDFGTSHTVAVLRRVDGRVETLLFDSSPLLPSAVYAGDDGTLSTGRDAVDAARRNPAALEPHPKRRVDDGSVLLGERDVPVVELFAAVLDRVRLECVQVLGGPPAAVTLSHPAAWGPARRDVLREATLAAGLPEPSLVPEPVAAATYFTRHLERDVPAGARVVVYDFGGGTFDASVVRRTDDGFEVLAVDGLDDLGGVDVDAAVVDMLRRRHDRPELWRRLLRPETPGERRMWHTFMADVRAAKERLSRQTTTDLHLPLFEVDVHLTRDELEDLTRPMLARAVEVVRALVEGGGQPSETVAGVFLVGGSSRMPLVATMLHRALGSAPVVVDQIDQVVAYGTLEVTGAPPVETTSVPPTPVSGPPVSSVVTDRSAASATYDGAPADEEAATTSVTHDAPSPDDESTADRAGHARLAAVVVAVVVLTVLVVFAPGWFVGEDEPEASGDSVTTPPGGTASESPEPPPGSPDTTYVRHDWSIEALEIIELEGRPVVASGAHTDPIRVWDAATGNPVSDFDGHDQTHDSITDIESAVIDGAPVMVSIGWGTEILVWDPLDGTEIRDIQVPDMGTVSMIDTGEADGEPVVVGASSYGFDDERYTEVLVWRISDGELVARWTAPVDTGSLHVSTAGDGATVALAGIDGDEPDRTVVEVRDVATGDLIETARPAGDVPEAAWEVSAAATPEGRIVTAVPGAPVQVWDGPDTVLEFTAHSTFLTALDAATWDDRTVAVSADDGELVYVWDTETGDVLASHPIGELGFYSTPTAVAAETVGGRLVFAVASFIGFTVFTWSMDPV